MSSPSSPIRRLDQKQSSLTDTQHHKLMNVKEDALSNKLKHLDVLYFPTLFPSGNFGESHDCLTPISLSEFIKLRLLNQDSCFRKVAREVSYSYMYLYSNKCCTHVPPMMLASVPGSLPYACAIFMYDLWTPRNEKSPFLSSRFSARAWGGEAGNKAK